MTGTRWSFHATCPRCGGDLTPVTRSEANATLNIRSSAIADCPACRMEWLLTAQLAPCRDGKLAPAGLGAVNAATGFTHGTRSGAMRHRKHGEKPCDDCRRAENEYAAERRRTRRAADA